MIKSNRFGFVEILGRLLNWAIIPLVGVFAAPDLYGQTVLISTSFLVLMTVAGFGQQRSVLQYDKAQKAEAHRAILVAMFFAIGLCAVGFVGLSLLSGSLPVIIAVAALFGVGHLLVMTQSRAFDDFKSFVFYRLGLSLGRGGLVLGALLGFGSLALYVAAELAAILAALLVQPARVREILSQTRHVGRAHFIRAGRVGGPILFQSIAFMAIMHYDKFAMIEALGAKALGQYGFVFAISSSLSFLIAFLGMRFEVRLYQSQSPDQAVKEALAYFKAAFLAHLLWGPVLFGLYICIQFISPTQGYHPYVFLILVLGQTAYNLMVCFSHLLTKLDGARYLYIAVSLVAVFSVTANTLYIRQFGIFGAASIFVISNILFLGLTAGLSFVLVRFKNTAPRPGPNDPAQK